MNGLRKSCTLVLLAFGLASATPKLPVGMNIPGNNYYSTCLIFTDVMKTASSWITYNATGESPWNTKTIDRVPLDENGYPLELPYSVDNTPQAVRFLINNHYEGEFVFLHDGEGEFTFHSMGVSERDGKTYITLDGEGGHSWVQIIRSEKDNHVRNIRILPVEYEDAFSVPTFHPLFIKGLEPFHCLRFMDWIHTNNSMQKEWSDRVTPTYYTQGGPNGMAFEYAIELCNQLRADGWFCVPHMADDNYIRQLAHLLKDNLDPDLHIYIEYSNEIWNWMFDQAQWVLHNGVHPHKGESTRALEQYVIDGLEAINSEPADHPEKDAFMMARLFRVFGEEFGEEMDRVTRVAAVQHSWYDNTRRILKYLFEVDGIGADAVSPTAYFNFSSDQHEEWNAMDSSMVTPEMICDSVSGLIEAGKEATLKNAEYGNQYGLDYIVYEGGQHMQPFEQKDWGYNQAVWDAQIHPRMYDLYMQNFENITLPEVDCKLYMAFSYVGARESKYGSWGHLENLDQLNNLENIKTAAPKYAALLDVNEPRDLTTGVYSNQAISRSSLPDLSLKKLSFSRTALSVRFRAIGAEPVEARIFSANGRQITNLDSKTSENAAVKWQFTKALPSGLYFICFKSGSRSVSEQHLLLR